jgi:DNA-binding MarR family transcriptional regulator
MRKPARKAALTVSRSELLIADSDQQFRRLVHNLLAFFARHSAIRDGFGAFVGLAGIEYTTLISIKHLAVAGDVSVRDLADHLHLSGAFTTTVTNKLLNKGLIEKNTDPRDKRRLCLTVSQRGDALLERLAPIQAPVNDAEFACLTAKEFQLLLDIVERLVKTSDQALALQHYLAETAPGAETVNAAAKPAASEKSNA